MGLVCTKCNQSKSEELFHKDSARLTGRTSACKDCRNQVERNRRRKALVHYSKSSKPFCVCCLEEEYVFLSLDHIDGGGNQQRKKLGGGGYWYWLEKNNYPEGFQVLCHNCNLGRQLNKGICPHLL